MFPIQLKYFNNSLLKGKKKEEIIPNKASALELDLAPGETLRGQRGWMRLREGGGHLSVSPASPLAAPDITPPPSQ